MIIRRTYFLAFSLACFLLIPINTFGSDGFEAIQDEIVRLHGEGKYREAIRYAKQNLVKVRKQFGPNSRQYANYLFTLGGLNAFAGRDTEARKYFNRAAVIQQHNKFRGHPLGIGTEGFFLMVERTKGRAIKYTRLEKADGVSPSNRFSRSPVADTIQKESVVTKRASGTFEVKLNPQVDEKVGDPTVGRMSIDKQFHGDLEGTSKGQMLAVSTDVQGSAGYVAMEHVSGKLEGRSGTFALQHSGTMTRGAPQLSVTVVPDSGTSQLVGLTGKMSINIVDGKHFYEFEYTLPNPN